MEMNNKEPSDWLTDEQCNEFRRLPVSFNDMVREIYMSGYKLAIDDMLKIDVISDDE